MPIPAAALDSALVGPRRAPTVVARVTGDDMPDIHPDCVDTVIKKLKKRLGVPCTKFDLVKGDSQGVFLSWPADASHVKPDQQVVVARAQLRLMASKLRWAGEPLANGKPTGDGGHSRRQYR